MEANNSGSNDWNDWNNKIMAEGKELPGFLVEKLREIMEENESPLVFVPSDLNLQGNFQESWLVLTNKRIIAATISKDGMVEYKTYALTLVKSAKLVNGYGSGAIKIQYEFHVVEIIRFTKKYLKYFSQFARYLQKIIENNYKAEIWENNEHPGLNANRCRECGRPAPEGLTLCNRCQTKKKMMKRLFGYLKPYTARIILMLMTTFAFTLVGLIQPYLQKFMIDEVLTKKQLDLLKFIVIAILAAHIFRSVLQGLRSFQLTYLGQKITFDLRSDVYSHLQKLSLSYFDKSMTGAIMTRVTGDTQELQQFIVNGLEEIIIEGFTMIIIAYFLFVMDWQLALIVLIPAPIIYFGTKYYNKNIRRVYRRIWRKRSNMNASLGGTIPGIRVIKAFAKEDEEIKRFHNIMEDFYQENIKAAKYQSIFSPALSVTTVIGSVLIWGYGGYRVIVENSITVGTLIAFTSYMWQFYQPIQRLSNLSVQYQRALTAIERVFEILDQKPEFVLEGGMQKPEIKGEIVFENVSFRYRDEEEVLNNVSLRIKPGEMVGLVGSSGSGKTTLVNLIPGFYLPTEGNIWIDGVNLLDMDLRYLRSRIGFVLQEPFLFPGTIWENITYGKPDATLEEVISAAKAANAHDFIMELSEGYDTYVGERGVGLSGGQKQRISIARAILTNPAILILDEATSSVDTEAEKLIQEALDRLTKNRTTIAIAHRLSTLKNADKIIVLAHGEIVEEGKHEELMAKNGVFRQLVEIQSEIIRDRDNVKEMDFPGDRELMRARDRDRDRNRMTFK